MRRSRKTATKPIKKNFRKPLDLVCSKDLLRPVMNHIYFDDGKSVCTDAHILLIRDLKLDGFTDEEIQVMNGKLLHKEVFKEIFRYNDVHIIDGKFHCTKGNVKAVFEFSSCTDKYPNYQAVINKTFDTVGKIKLNLNYLSILKKVAENPSLLFNFSGENKAVLATSVDDFNEETILLIPIMNY